jgi:dUTP pyrophosphatase
MEIKVARLREDAYLPHYAHPEEDSGLDVYIPKEDSYEILPLMTQVIPLGLRVQLPKLQAPFRLELEIRPRSGLSLTTKLRIANAPGTIDFGYRGELSVIVENIGEKMVSMVGGMKLAQIIPNVILACTIKEVAESWLSGTTRSYNGFGSTGLIAEKDRRPEPVPLDTTEP